MFDWQLKTTIQDVTKDVFATPQNAKKMFFKLAPSLPFNFLWCAVDLWVEFGGHVIDRA